MKKYYEIVLILNVNMDRDRTEKMLNRIKERISQLGGEVYSLEDMGKKRLAYLINKQKYGAYYLFKYGCHKPIVTELNRWMKINDDIMAHLQVSLDDEPERIEEIEKYGQSVKPTESSSEEVAKPAEDSEDKPDVVVQDDNATAVVEKEENLET